MKSEQVICNAAVDGRCQEECLCSVAHERAAIFCGGKEECESAVGGLVECIPVEETP